MLLQGEGAISVVRNLVETEPQVWDLTPFAGSGAPYKKPLSQQRPSCYGRQPDETSDQTIEMHTQHSLHSSWPARSGPGYSIKPGPKRSLECQDSSACITAPTANSPSAAFWFWEADVEEAVRETAVKVRKHLLGLKEGEKNRVKIRGFRRIQQSRKTSSLAPDPTGQNNLVQV